MKRETLLCLQQKIAYGDEQAFERLMHETMPVLHAYALRMLRDQQLSEEVVMDVFVKLWQNRTGFGEVSNPLFYLLKAVKNTALNYLKSPARKALSAAELAEDRFALQISPEDVLISKEHIQQIQQALDELPPRSREVLLLCKEYRLSYAEVAELLGISQATVNVHMTQALKKLWQMLEALHLVSS